MPSYTSLLERHGEAVAEGLRAGRTYQTIGDAIGLTKGAVAGLVSRLRATGAPGVPAPGKGAAVSKKDQRNALADAFVEGAKDLSAAAARAGMTIATARSRWDEVRRQLGRQAS